MAKQMQAVGSAVEKNQALANSRYQNVEGQVALAKHAETWEWKDVHPIRLD